jgi:hypothetical protein
MTCGEKKTLYKHLKVDNELACTSMKIKLHNERCAELETRRQETIGQTEEKIDRRHPLPFVHVGGTPSCHLSQCPVP